MHGAAGPVAVQLRHLQRLEHDALAGESRIAVHEHGQHRGACHALGELLLPRAGHALHHRIDGLEMARVARQFEAHLLAGEGRVVGDRAEVVLHVARALRHVRVEVALELPEDARERLAQNVREHVEAAAVRHAQHRLVDTLLGPALQQRVEHGDERLAALEREALVADEARVQEALEGLGLDELVEDPQHVLARQ